MATRTLRETLWSIATTVVLVARFLATLGCVAFGMLWLVSAFRDTLLNGWMWWAIGSAIVLGVASYLYSILRVRYSVDEDEL